VWRFRSTKQTIGLGDTPVLYAALQHFLGKDDRRCVTNSSLMLFFFYAHYFSNIVCIGNLPMQLCNIALGKKKFLFFFYK
jgi:hypothetical protein